MRRRTYRRLIVLLALVCQVLTGTIVHVPAAVAAPATTTKAMAMAMATATAHETPPCHEHGLDDAQDHTVSGMSVDNHAPTPAPASPFHHCKSGACTCVCAHAAALPVTATPQPPVFSHPPLPSSVVVPDAPVCVSVFFRPPI